MLHPAIDDIAQNTSRHCVHIERLFNQTVRCKQLQTEKVVPRFYVSTSKSIIKALINMHSFEIQLSPIG
ncbi:hypothetical protein DZ618_08110 [Salmonella enterica]|nr:hypothetical protein [Salmonella enterica]